MFDSQMDEVLIDGRRVFNSYAPSTLIPEPAPWPDIYRVVVHLCNGQPRFVDYLLGWLARQLQSLWGRRITGRRYRRSTETLVPWGTPLKMNTAVVAHGVPGVGKELLFAGIMRTFYGDENVVVIGQGGLDSTFHGQLINKLFVFANEVVTGSNRTAETENFLKTLITDPVVPIEDKHVRAKNVPNYANYAFASNNAAPVIIGKGDRRFSVKKSETPVPRAIGKRVHEDLVGARNQVSGFLWHLLHRRLTVDVGDLYENSDKEAIQRETASSDDKFVRAVLEDGLLGVGATWEKAAPYSPNGEKDRRIITMNDGDRVLSDTIEEVYNFYCKQKGLKSRGVTKLAETLKTLIPTARRCWIYKPTKLRAWTGIPLVPREDREAAPKTDNEVPLRSEVEQSQSQPDDGDFGVSGESK